MTLLAAVGSARALDGREAGLQATHQALNELGNTPPIFGLVISSYRYEAQQVINGVSSLTGSMPLIGFSTSAGITLDGIHPHSVVVALLAASDARADIQWLAGYTQASREVSQQLAELFKRKPKQPALLFADGFNADAEQLCSSLPPGANLVGGLSSGDLHTGNAYQISGAQFGAGGLALARLEGRIRVGARNLSLALGASGVTLQELVNAYGVLANGGKKVTPFFIKKIVDRTGNVFEETKVISEQVIDPRIAFMTSYVMRDVVESGTGRRVKSLGRPVAGKTGTTNDIRDAWFIGFTPSLIAGVWIGFDQETTLGKNEVGGRAAAPVWLYFMEKVMQRTPVEAFPTPEGIIFVKVDPKTGLASGGSDSGAIYEAFLDSAPPNEKADSLTEEKEDLFR